MESEKQVGPQGPESDPNAQLTAGEDLHVEEAAQVAAKRKQLIEEHVSDSDQAKRTRTEAPHDTVTIDDDSDSDPEDADVPDVSGGGAAESVESLLAALGPEAVARAETEAGGTATPSIVAPPRTILSPEEKSELLLVIKHLLNVCQTAGTPREKRLQATPLVSRLVDLMPATLLFFTAHGWRGLKFRARRFDPDRLLRQLLPLQGLEAAVYSAQAQDQEPKVSYAEATEKTVLRRSVLVTGLPPVGTYMHHEVTTVFETFGPLSQPPILGSTIDPRLATAALVQFRTPGAAAKAKGVGTIVFRGHRLDVSGATDLQLTTFGIVLPSAKAKGAAPDTAPTPDPVEGAKRTLVVKGLPGDSLPILTLEYYLVQLLQPYGPLVYAVQRPPGRPTTAVVRYQTEQQASTAIQRVNGVAFYGARVLLHYATPEEVSEHGPLHLYQPPPPIPPSFSPPPAPGTAPGPKSMAPLRHPPPASFPRQPVAVPQAKPPASFSPTPAGISAPDVRLVQRKQEIQAKKTVDAFLSDYEAFYAAKLAQEVEEYGRLLATGPNPAAASGTTAPTAMAPTA